MGGYKGGDGNYGGGGDGGGGGGGGGSDDCNSSENSDSNNTDKHQEEKSNEDQKSNKKKRSILNKGSGGGGGGGDDDGGSSGDDNDKNNDSDSEAGDSIKKRKKRKKNLYSKKRSSNEIIPKINGYCDYDCDEDIKLLSTLCMDPCDFNGPIDTTSIFDCLEQARRAITDSDLDHCGQIMDGLLKVAKFDFESKMKLETYKLSLYSKINEYRLKNKEEDQKTYRIMTAINNKTITANAQANISYAEAAKINMETTLSRLSIPKIQAQVKRDIMEQYEEIAKREYSIQRWKKKDSKPNAKSWKNILKQYKQQSIQHEVFKTFSEKQPIKSSSFTTDTKSKIPKSDIIVNNLTYSSKDLFDEKSKNKFNLLSTNESILPSESSSLPLSDKKSPILPNINDHAPSSSISKQNKGKNEKSNFKSVISFSDKEEEKQEKAAQKDEQKEETDEGPISSRTRSKTQKTQLQFEENKLDSISNVKKKDKNKSKKK